MRGKRSFRFNFFVFILCLAISYVQDVQDVQAATKSGNEFNPAINLILDGRYTSYGNDFALPGFVLGGEAGLPEKGFGLGHSELSLSANIDPTFYGAMIVALHQEEGETHVELEEAYVETLKLDHGLTLKMGKFRSQLGYLNSIHEHAHDFTDVPLVYSAFFGNSLIDSGMQLRWVVPIDAYVELGGEWLSGTAFPGGTQNHNNQGGVLFAKTGGDLSESTSWQLGSSLYRTKFDERSGAMHEHSDTSAEHVIEYSEGGVKAYGVDFVYKWAPRGNATQKNLKIQGEFFIKKEDSAIHFSEAENNLLADFSGKGQGLYVQTLYQFMPKWRVGVRADYLKPDNQFSNEQESGVTLQDFFDDTLLNADKSIIKKTIMIDYSTSEFAKLRFQVANIDIENAQDTQVMLQYLMSLGSHGAHKF